MRVITTAVLLIAALAVGCGGTDGVRRGRLTGAGGNTGVDGGTGGSSLPPFMCSGSVSGLNCAAPFMLPADGHVTDFSNREWNSATGKWCDEAGMHGSIFSFKGTAPNDSNAISVNTMDSSLRLSVSVSAGSYAGGGVAFEAGCLNASAFAGLQFSVAIASGSLTGYTYQIQLQTFEQRPTTQNPAGGCDQNTTSCYGFPAARNLPAPSTDPTMPTPVMVPFSSFAMSLMMPTQAQIVGLQWQVNSSPGACTVELRLDDIGFIPASPPPDAGAGDDASAATNAPTD